jgi:lipoate-protein ligase A
MALARVVERPTLVLGSTQRVELVGNRRVHERGVDVVRRRGGGGAVFLQPGDHLWVDVWLPCDDPLWVVDVSAAAAWVGAWWSAALAGFGVEGLDVHAGRSVPGEFGELVCFAGRGPGEVFQGGRKLMGLSQWRAREGALFSTCAYAHWDPAGLIELVHVDESVRASLIRDLTPMVVGVGDLIPARPDLGLLQHALLSSLPTWGSDGSSFSG